MQRLIWIILSSFLFIATPALAGGNAATMWIVSQRSGDVRVVRSGFQPAAASANAALAPGDIIATGATGRATLARGSDYIVVAPRSELRLPATPQPSGYTRVIQTLGTMMFKVRHTGVPHFAVDTPMLAAVVKGTTFTIVVDKDRSAVQVIEGQVQVVATAGGMQGLVEGGRTVFIDRSDPKRLITADARTLASPAGSSDSAIKIKGSEGESLATVAALTSGLVRAEATSNSTAKSADDSDPVMATLAPVNESAVPVQSGVVAPAAVATVNPTIAPAVSPSVTVAAAMIPAATVNPTIAPAVSPSVTVAAAIFPAATASIPAIVVSTPTVTTPTITTPVATVPSVTAPVIVAIAAVPSVSTPILTTPPVTVPSVTVPALTTPVVTVPTLTTPILTVPIVTEPALTTPVVTVPKLPNPTITIPIATEPASTTPTVTVPSVTSPTVTTPTVIAQPVTVPLLPAIIEPVLKLLRF